MLVGHLAVGMFAKRAEPRISLGTLTLAALTPDVLWCVFMIAGIEHAQISPGSGQAIALDASYSHSLLMDVVWGALFAAAFVGQVPGLPVRNSSQWQVGNLPHEYRRGAWILFAAVLSHWLLDFISHPPDLTLAPGMRQHFGLGLWSSIPATLVVEGGLWVAALIVYIRATRAKNRAGIWVFWPVVVFLTAAWINNFAGPPPPDVSAMAVSSLIFFSLVIGWTYAMNRLRLQG